uniref:Uncharacterized protein n=1 Tax=virus sp. ctML55 TaxID=2827627 RepID=A0A8S5RI66_9VIRU|nr:MAG TPA: hypothetical protein [virus sp. ctML55]
MGCILVSYTYSCLRSIFRRVPACQTFLVIQISKPIII